MESDSYNPIDMRGHRFRVTANDSGPKYNRDGLDTREYLARNGVCGQEPEAAAAHQAVFDAQAELIFAEQAAGDADPETTDLAETTVDNMKARLKGEVIPNAIEYCGRCAVAITVCKPFVLEWPNHDSGIFAGLDSSKRKSIQRSQKVEAGLIKPKKSKKAVELKLPA